MGRRELWHSPKDGEDMKRILPILLMLLVWITPCKATEQAQEPVLFPAEAYSQVIVPEALRQVRLATEGEGEVREIYPIFSWRVAGPEGQPCWMYEIGIVVRTSYGSNGVKAVEESIYTAFFVYDPAVHRVIFIQHGDVSFDSSWYEVET